MTTNPDLLLSSYHYDLPQELIAARPAEPRHNSRLMVYDEATGQVAHDTFLNLSRYLPEQSELVLNRSKVFPCRLMGQKKTGGKVEVFVLSLEPIEGSFRCLIKSSSKKKVGDQLFFEQEVSAKIEACDYEGAFLVSFNKDIEFVMEELGKVPIPPYIRNGLSDERDTRDYQTLYAKDTGSVAAPTAGLHFTDEVFAGLDDKGIGRSYVTLHVGMGTFAPVKEEDITKHHMHHENFFVEQDQWQRIVASPKRFAVGTTSLRVLESLWPKRDRVEARHMYDTDIFLHPGVDVHSISGLVTNFHLPGSTLLMLVSSLIGREKTLELYELAVREKYRFFSYGDAMLILRRG